MRPESMRAMHPVAFGAAIEVPFISCSLESDQFGTLVMAEPGAVMQMAWPPSWER